MAIDGSFCADFELRRLLARCPKLGSDAQLSALAEKSCGLTDEEVVNSVAELFINPNYTIPLVGCFRAIAQKIVDKAVAVLRLVPNLRSDVAGEDTGQSYDDFDGGEAVRIINFLVQRGRGLYLHELTCLALCRAIDLVPSLLGSVLRYFEFAPPPFERILSRRESLDLLSKALTYLLLKSARTSYRLLLLETEVFSKLWDWSCFLDLVQQSSKDDKCLSAEIHSDKLDLSWCGVQILSVILKMSIRFDQSFHPEEVPESLARWEELLLNRTGDGNTSFFRWREFCQDVSLEKAGWYLEPLEPNTKVPSENGLTNTSAHYHTIHSELLSGSQLSRTKPTISNRRLQQCSRVNDAVAGPFVLTSALKKSFEMIVLAMSQKWPVLLHGPAGSGKTALVNTLATETGNQVLSIHMDDQIDAKTLVGSYVCTEQPGEFRWQPGSLTQAILNGLWVIFEDIDKAPVDVQCILLPLLEGTNSFITGNGEVIRVAESFRLISTITTSKLDASLNARGGNSVAVLWRRVMVGPPNVVDMQKIVEAWYPSLGYICGKIVETFEYVKLGSIHRAEAPPSFLVNKFSLRDILKWCKRIAGLGYNFTEDVLSPYQCQCIYQEAVDVFAAFAATTNDRLNIMKLIAKLWAVPSFAIETVYPPNKPVLKDFPSESKIGRITLPRVTFQQMRMKSGDKKKAFVELKSSVHTLERIAASVFFNEPVLLVGETGTGKTTLVQNLAARVGQKLSVLNLSQQTDVADLLGGFKPVDAQFVCVPLYKDFEALFSKTFSMKNNSDYLTRIQKYLSDKNWRMLLVGFQKGVEFYQNLYEAEKAKPGKKRKKLLDGQLYGEWEEFVIKLNGALRQTSTSSGMIFSFVEGAFVTALQNGEWILLDEVNLAPPETLQRVIGVLEGESSSFCLAERGDIDYVYRHPNFRIFACMNPATDAGKRDLPNSLRSRFTEYYVDDVLDDEDLNLFISQFVDENHANGELVKQIMCFYKEAKKESEERLQDGANQKPQYSLRSLYRALEYTRKGNAIFGGRSPSLPLYDGFAMFFLTLLDAPSAKLMENLISKCLFPSKKLPPREDYESYLKCLSCQQNPTSDSFLESYVLTKSVREHLRNLARAVLIRRYPVLLQGPTSSGKTSLVQYLAAKTGREFVRINNHEHTDLQEYLGSYITDASGKLVFQEGSLVKAVRNGHWIVLDELNLAPSDVLEALNRLLDDNRELYVPELCETVKAHPDFMLFATQNPPTFYGGRKMLSRAFRNRFVEIHVDDIPEEELCNILHNKCQIPESYARKMVDVMKELQLHRQRSKVFAGKHGFITPRDLFRWANRFRTFGTSYEDLAKDGYFLLGERLRDESEKKVVQDILQRCLRVKLVTDDLYNQRSATNGLVKHSELLESVGNITWTKSMWRLYYLVERCFKLREPVLLVGETGGGKTTVCQLLSSVLGSKLHILNCHQYTETSDFLGSFRPLRERSKLSSEYSFIVEKLLLTNPLVNFPNRDLISLDIGQASSTLSQLELIFNSYNQGLVSWPSVSVEDLENLLQKKQELSQLYGKWQTIFTWEDGPLIQAMKDGDLLLVDEISLADDSVLERLNSVLELERKLSLAEKGGSTLETISAHQNFYLLATMNPGGDYGKKELSPALRNRFTEIWVPTVNDIDELRSISLQRISNPGLSLILEPMIHFWEWFNKLQVPRTLTVRDLLSWVDFINVTQKSLQPDYALVHGAFLVLLDGICLGTSISKVEARELRERCVSYLIEQMKAYSVEFDESLTRMQNYGWGDLNDRTLTSGDIDMEDHNLFGVAPFFIEKGNKNCDDGRFMLTAPTTRRNAARVLRALQLAKPVLLEGSPGVGKTSLIDALGKFSGHRVVRINLSEQTDIIDLLGSDLPVDSHDEVKFAWSDGILLQAIKDGCWVLLDELNLAPQSVLEGLNAILDHRAEVYIPELGLTFKCPPSFRVFACQNPSHQGGGRKGLPKSFLNRFTKVYVDELNDFDYLCIIRSLHPSIPDDLLKKLILFNKKLHEDTMLYHKFAQNGAPWEFNLRDVLRACQLIEGSLEEFKDSCFLNVIYIQRMRTSVDRREVLKLYEQVFGHRPFINPYPRVQINSGHLLVGSTTIKQNSYQSCKTSISQIKILPDTRHSLEAATQCVKYERLCIIVGPPSSGKTTLVRLLAQLTGNVLHEINLSPATDISELLGCFEQYNAVRTFRSLVSQVECYMNEYCDLQLQSSWAAFIEENKELVSKWFTIISSIENGEATGKSSFVDTMKNFSDSLRLLAQIVEDIQFNLAKDSDMDKSPASNSFVGINSTRKSIMKLLENIEKGAHPAKFEWITGVLVKAIERGDWIVLENANLCNPTVLDRINSLLEQGGSITINECGTIDGKPLVIHPHPKFRMFLTVDPSYGEVSRAMRNRGVEIYLMQPYWLFDEAKRRGLVEAEYMDLNRFLVLGGIPVRKLVDMMVKAHLYARDQGLRLNLHLSYHELTLWIQLFQQLLSKGNGFIWSLQTSWEHTYICSFGVADVIEVIKHGKQFFLSEEELANISSTSHSSLHLPGGWPMPLLLRDFVLYPEGSSVWQNCMYMEHLGAEYAAYESSIGKDNYIASKSPTGNFHIDMTALHHIMFPNASRMTGKLHQNQNTYDLRSAKKMICFAFNWTIEQATERDLQLHLQWISRVSSELRPFCQCIESFLGVRQQLLKHKIWKDILCYRNKLLSQYSQDKFLQSVPILSLELSYAAAACPLSNETSTRLKYAIKCLDLLTASVYQWSAEVDHVYEEKKRRYEPMLEHLKALEEAMLDELLKSPSEELFLLYTDLFDTHILFWNGVMSSEFDHISISLNSLNKVAVKIYKFFRSAKVCPRAIIEVLTEIKGLFDAYFGKSYSKKSLLWKHGGHPILPSSPEVYHEQCKYLDICQSIWHRHTNLVTTATGSQIVDVVISFVPELRTLAMQGLCLSSCITEESEEDCSRQLGEMQQMLFQRVEHEKEKFSWSLLSNEHACPSSVFASCCDMSPEILSHESAFISYLEAVPVIDNKCLFLDMELLQELSDIVLSEKQTAQIELSRISHRIENTLSYSLASSSRPPIDFTPHQKILWTLDAWKSLDSATAKATSFVQEMWFSWHLHIWSCLPDFVENLSSTGRPSTHMPHILLRPVRAMVNKKILESAMAIKDYPVHCLKLRMASRNLWHASRYTVHLPNFLLSVARSLFRQIIYAHKKTFDADAYYELKSRLDSWGKAAITTEDILGVLSIINSSTHLASAVMYIEPLMKKLFLHSSSAAYLHNLGCAWLLIGGLRFQLLLSKGSIDPVSKYGYKYSHLLEQTRFLELEIKVRQECNYLAGLFRSRERDRNKVSVLENLQAEQDIVKKKIVFRSDPKKFKKLKDECMEFNSLIKASMSFISNLEYLDMDKVHNWQETATSFIERLSNEYSAYADIIQPIQVAVYEMKLGVSLVQSGVKQTKLLKNTGHDNMEKVEEMVYSFVRYPRESAFKSCSVTTVDEDLNIFLYGVHLHTINWESRRSLLEKLIKKMKDANSADKMPNVQLEAAINQDAIVRITQAVASSRVLDKTSFKEINRIFEWFANHWMKLKEDAKIKEAFESQEYKFRPRTLKTDTIFEFDESILNIFSSSETFQEWQDFISQDEAPEMEPSVECDTSEESWELIPDSILSKLVQVHNRLFGSVDLTLNHGAFTVPESESMESFIESYSLGVGIVDGLGGLSSSNLDAKLAPEHMLRLSLDLNQNIELSHKGNQAYNFYKDPNTSAVAKMVEIVAALQQRIVSLSKEWVDHPGLQKILEVCQILLALPRKTPLDKALSGLQFLLNRIQLLQENGSKFPLSDHIKRITDLASTWKKMEFESWPFLINEVQAECDSNAAKLWFPLYTLLRMRDTSDINEYVKSTIESLEEFVHMSSIGEFKRRLHLLLAFHVQISRGLLFECYSSPCEMENLKILYHVLGYYMQFLPVILGHVNTHKTSVQKELDELLKLCKWEHPESYLCMANTKRVRQKLKKLIQKYTDILQQPVMVILKQEEMRRGINKQSSSVATVHTDIICKNKSVIDTPLNLDEFDESRCSWFETWRQNAHSCWQNMSTDIATVVEGGLTSQAGHVVYPEELNSVWSILKKLFSTAKGCNQLWNDMNTTLGKRRALSEFLKLLESCGLSRHKSAYYEDQHKSNLCSQWFLQPSYDTNHLLMKQNDKHSENTSSDKAKVLPAEGLVDEWKTANKYHFKSLASVELLRQIRLNFHTDFNLEQVRRSVSYLDHFIMIQQEQRASAYAFSKQVRHTEKSLFTLRNLIASSPNSEAGWAFLFVPHQQQILSCMWQQKRIFDRLWTMLSEADSFLRLAESIHLNTCQSVKPWTHKLQKFIQKLVPDCQNSKEMLDHFLLDDETGITAVGGSQQFLVIISKQDLESVVEKNFLTLTMLEESVLTFRENLEQRVAVEDIMLSHFDDIFKEGKSIKEQLEYATETRLEISDSVEKSCSESYSELYAKFHGSFKKSLELAAATTLALGYSQNEDHLSEEFLCSIPSWTALFDSYTNKLQLEGLCDNLFKTIGYAGELVKHHENDCTSLTFELGKNLNMLEQLTDKILKFSDGLLRDFLTMHKTVCALSLFLADIFSSLYSTGFGNSEKQEDGCDDTSQDAKGTGMGEGVGAKDVSDQLTDEDQLLGTVEQKEEQDGANEDPGKNDKGIEMEEDFEADTFSVSEDSGEDEKDDNDDDDEQLESAMGDAGTESAVVDQKSWDKSKDEKPESNEKYETGSSMKDQNGDDRELRGKEDSEDTLPNDFDPAEGNENDGEAGEDGENGDDLEENENMEDANMDKDEAFAEPTGLDIVENNQEQHESMDLDPQEDGTDEAENAEEGAESAEGLEENLDETDVTLDEGEQEQLDENSEMDNIEKGKEDDSNMDVDVNGQDASDTQSTRQPKVDLQAIGSNYAPEVNWSNSSDIQNNPTSAEGLPGTDASENEVMMADASNKGRPTNDKSDTQVSDQSAPKSQKNQPNPYRSVGDALQEWKERAKVSIDVGEGDKDGLDDMVEDDPDEYGYVPESETGTAQALGAATSDQVNNNLNGNKPDEELTAQDENVSEMDSEQKNAETNPVQNGAMVQRNKMEEPAQNLPLEDPAKEQVPEEPNEGEDSEGLSNSLVSVKRSFMSSGIGKLNELSLSDDEPLEGTQPEIITNDMKDDASKKWRSYELRTTRLSQELAEQLRLVMEPTLASKLQGDYKTGKRINMKKVIPYIASQYRKDKIWLRRTRPNKRDYQVVIAVDDSRSMSESSCGDAAIEALVTVCRAMSQLEVGSLAVTSFGKKGNVKLLHDFDQPFSGEAGVKMVSSFTFKQENTIADEPVVDLLRYMNNMLDNAVSNARLPNGQNPLQQLVLIIADGRFHEKKKLRRIVRDAMSRRRLIAFLLVDSPEESIMDLMEVSFEKEGSPSGGMKMSKYLDSFPFPYYIVLKDMDSLPRTLADLMRQWFELMQQSGE
ncbi:unnamed protein product [Rhodiola kirilowii]